MKTLGADYNAADGVIRIHTPEKLKGQEEFKAERAETLKTKLALEESVEPILAQMFKLYYIEPAQAKLTLENLFGLGGDGGGEEESVGSVSSNLSITVESTTRSIIVRGYQKDLDIVDAVVKEIDVRTKQVLIEAFVVEADKTFSKGLGSRIAAMSKKGTSGEPGSSVISGTTGGAATTSGGISLGAAAGTVTENGLTGATSGIGIIKTFSTAALKIELEALESLGTTRIVSSPSVFTLNNQEAKVTQGTEIPYTVIVDGEATVEFKEVALSLTVTPSIIGDGNVLLDILVSNDSPDTTLGTDEPAIKTNEIDTKLLITDGDIVVIGGIKIDSAESTGSATPGLSKVPVVGNLFKGKSTTDKLDEMLIFIAPRVVD
jgi:type IV pilus assembly protein PilQ